MGFDLKGLGGKALDGLKKGVEKGIAETKKQIKITHLKNQIQSQKLLLVRRFNNNLVSAFCREQGISFEKSVTYTRKDGSFYTKKEKKTSEELVHDAIRKPYLTLFAFAERYRISGYYEIKNKITELEREIRAIEGKIIEEPTPTSLYDRIVEELQKFKPVKQYNYESEYEAALSTYLQNIFPGSMTIQPQRGVSRPDIAIEDIAIEIKGPTFNADLTSLEHKASGYTSDFHGGLIIILFDLQAKDFFFQKWKNDFQRHFPNVKIIEK